MVSWGAHKHNWILKSKNSSSEYYECECGASRVVSRRLSNG